MVKVGFDLFEVFTPLKPLICLSLIKQLVVLDGNQP